MKNAWKLLLIIVVGIIAVFGMCVFGIQSVQNKAFMLEEKIKVANSDIKVQEKRRADLIPNLVDCVKEYDKYEYESLLNIVKARGSNSDSVASKIQTKITAIAESYPELKSQSNYKQLMNELSITENMIAEYRSNYNKQVEKYNRYIKKFQVKIFLDILGYESQDYKYLDYNVSSDAPTNLFGE